MNRQMAMPERRGRLIHPAVAMAVFWSLLYAVYWLAPIRQTPAVSIEGFAFTAMFVVLFAVSAWLSSVPLPGRRRSSLLQLPGNTRFSHSRLIAMLALIGCAGALMSIISKSSAEPLAALIDAAALRNERAQQLLDADTLTSGPLSALAFLLYPAGFPAIFAAVLSYEKLDARTRAVALLYVPLAFLQSVVAGGRSGILVLLILIAIATYVRHHCGLPRMPKSKAVKWTSLVLATAFLLYSTAVWFVRAALSELTNDAFLELAEQSWGVTPNPILESLANILGLPGLVQNVMSTLFYFTQSLSVTERVLTMPSSPILLGAYHIDIVAAAMRVTSSSRDFLATGYASLLDANVYGFFTGAWSALYIDYGLVGAMLYTVVWGVLAGRAFRLMVRVGSDDHAAMYGFSIYAVLVSFVSPPLGFSNSALTLFWFIVFAVGIRRRPIRRRSTAVLT